MKRLIIHILVIIAIFFGVRFMLHLIAPDFTKLLATPNAAGRSWLNMICFLFTVPIWSGFNKVYPLGRIMSGSDQGER